MWQTVQYVTTGVTLVAFLWAGAVVLLRIRLRERERLISSANPRDRPTLVRDALESFHIPTEKLTRDQQYSALLEQMRRKAERFKITAMIVALVALLFAAVTAYAISRVSAEQRPVGTPTIEENCNVPVKDRPLDCKP
jgi:ABC-type glycerol-3-phosphate transport system permease component